jgi:hypothetical protein
MPSNRKIVEPTPPIPWETFLAHLKAVARDADGALTAIRQGAAEGTHSPAPGQDAWYETTYEPFVERARQLETADDFFVVAAFAYSWAARIPTRNPRQAWQSLRDKFHRLRDPDDSYPTSDGDRTNLLTALMSSFTGKNGVVMASKILHFTAPHKIPMIDSRVAMAWNAAWRKVGDHQQDWFLVNEGAGQIKEAQFIRYWAQLDSWMSTTDSGRSYRALEKTIFMVGRKVAMVATEKETAEKRASKSAR